MPNVLAIALLVMTCVAQAAPTQLTYTLVKERAHPNLAFTQGLLIQGGDVFEASGGYGKSFVQRYTLEPTAPTTGPMPNRPLVHHLPRRDFAEGLALTPQGLWLLTWQQGLAKRLDPNDFSVQQVARYQGQGWGLTYDGQHLIMSNGSDQLIWRDTNFNVVRTQAVTFNGQPLARINELEFAHQLVWANVWFEPLIVAISPNTGNVLAYLDLSEIIKKETKKHAGDLPSEATLNGIAYDKHSDTFWVTGKNWRTLYQLSIHEWPIEN